MLLREGMKEGDKMMSETEISEAKSIDVSSADKFYFNDECSVTWMYYNPDGNYGAGQMVTTIIDEKNMQQAYTELNTLSATDQKLAVDSFFNTLYSECKTYIDDNDGSSRFADMVNAFNSDDADMVIENIAADPLQNAEKITDFFRRADSYFDRFVSNKEEAINQNKGKSR